LFPEEKYSVIWLTMQNNMDTDSKAETKDSKAAIIITIITFGKTTLFEP
jgi:hypothetical protein